MTDLARRLRIAKSTAHRLLATLTDEALLEQDPTTGRYGLVVMNLIRAGGLLTVALVAGFVFLMRRRETRAAVERHA